GIRKILPQTPKLTDTNNIISILQIDALITFTEKDLRSLLVRVFNVRYLRNANQGGEI
ncbi:MAG: hypothetical protein RLZ22_581, partial [Verrucomicrobiota bacterium]